jgi:hypothetical protein
VRDVQIARPVTIIQQLWKMKYSFLNEIEFVLIDEIHFFSLFIFMKIMDLNLFIELRFA